MIFNFSATGNSKYVAEKLQAALGGEIVKIDDALRRKEYTYKVEDGEKVFFVFPVYFFSMPTVVEEFIEKLQLDGSPEICAVITCGSSIGGADRLFKKAFKNKTGEIKAVYKLPMVDNYILMFKAPLKEEQVMKLRRADKVLENIIDNINYNFRVSYESNIFIYLASILTNKIYKATNKTKKFYATDRCISCGLCQFHCPVAAIKMEDGKPKWTGERCAHCLACIHRCPAEAIEYGKATAKRGRYVNPIFK